MLIETDDYVPPLRGAAEAAAAGAALLVEFDDGSTF